MNTTLAPVRGNVPLEPDDEVAAAATVLVVVATVVGVACVVTGGALGPCAPSVAKGVGSGLQVCVAVIAPPETAIDELITADVSVNATSFVGLVGFQTVFGSLVTTDNGFAVSSPVLGTPSGSWMTTLGLEWISANWCVPCFVFEPAIRRFSVEGTT